MNKIIAFTLTFIVLHTSLFAETYQLDLEKSIEIAKEKSFDMLQLRQDLKIAEYGLKSATSNFKTKIDLNLDAPNFEQSVKLWKDSTGSYFYNVNEMGYSGNLVIKQPLPTDGNISVVSNFYNTDDYYKNIRSTEVNTSLRLTQPINSLFGYNEIRSDYKRALLAYEQSQKSMKREELNLIYSVTNVFFNMISVQKSKELSKLNLDRQKEAYTIAKNKFDAGLIREVDALQMEVDLAEAQNNYDLALVNQSSALNSFKETIGLELSDSVTLSSELTYKIVVVDPNKAVKLAMENRLEIREREIQIELAKLSIKQQKAAGMIKGSLNAYLQKQGVNSQSIPNDLSSSVNTSVNDFINRRPNYSVGLSVSIPILDWGYNKAQVNIRKARLQQQLYTQEETNRSIEREVLNLVDELNSSLKRLQLLEKNVLVAEKSFSITRQRFSDGNIDSQALALERERLNGAYTSHLRAYINYQLMLADIMRKTFYDFQREIVIK